MGSIVTSSLGVNQWSRANKHKGDYTQPLHSTYFVSHPTAVSHASSQYERNLTVLSSWLAARPLALSHIRRFCGETYEYVPSRISMEEFTHAPLSD